MGVFINDEPSPMHVIETYLRNTERFGPGGATRSATEIIEALQTAGWNFISSEGYGRFVTAEAALRRLESDDGSEDPVERPVHRPGDPLFPSFMQALITYMGASTGP